MIRAYVRAYIHTRARVDKGEKREREGFGTRKREEKLARVLGFRRLVIFNDASASLPLSRVHERLSVSI